MKEYDVVKVMKGRERYARQGVFKGMVGTIMDSRNINGQWYVIFSDTDANDIADIAILEEDLEIVLSPKKNISSTEWKRLMRNWEEQNNK